MEAACSCNGLHTWPWPPTPWPWPGFAPHRARIDRPRRDPHRHCNLPAPLLCATRQPQECCCGQRLARVHRPNRDGPRQDCILARQPSGTSKAHGPSLAAHPMRSHRLNQDWSRPLDHLGLLLAIKAPMPAGSPDARPGRKHRQYPVRPRRGQTLAHSLYAASTLPWKRRMMCPKH